VSLFLECRSVNVESARSSETSSTIYQITQRKIKKTGVPYVDILGIVREKYQCKVL
jgi:hypothetical protein